MGREEEGNTVCREVVVSCLCLVLELVPLGVEVLIRDVVYGTWSTDAETDTNVTDQLPLVATVMFSSVTGMQ